MEKEGSGGVGRGESGQDEGKQRGRTANMKRGRVGSDEEER